ncbi:hypothetical protein Tco_0519909 [Tanacetum coccineum]
MNVEALQTKYPIIDWEIYTEGTRKYWKIIRVGNHTKNLYDSCGVHNVSTEKGIDIYMLVEKEYPLSRETLTLMLVLKLFVDQDNEISKELLQKIFMQVVNTILENMDAYRDEGMGDVIFGEPFLREVGIKARRFEGMIIIYNGNDEVTYQIVRSHPRFKNHTNEQCNKIPPLLKDPITFEMRGWKNASHAGTLACMRWNGEEKLKKRLP